jgi:hypothetical protein
LPSGIDPALLARVDALIEGFDFAGAVPLVETLPGAV